MLQREEASIIVNDQMRLQLEMEKQMCIFTLMQEIILNSLAITEPMFDLQISISSTHAMFLLSSVTAVILPCLR